MLSRTCVSLTCQGQRRNRQALCEPPLEEKLLFRFIYLNLYVNMNVAEMQTKCKCSSMQFDYSLSLSIIQCRRHTIIPRVHVVIYGHFHIGGRSQNFTTHNHFIVTVVHIRHNLKLIVVEEMLPYPAAVCPV